MEEQTIRGVEHVVPGRHGAWVTSGVLFAFLGYGVVAASGLLLRPDGLRDILAESLVATVSLVGLALAIKGRHSLAALIVLCAIWLELMTGLYLAGRLNAAGALVSPVLILAVGLFRGGRPAIALAALTAVAAPVAALAGARIHEPTTPAGGGLHWVVVHSAVVLATALLVHMALHTLRSVLESAWRSERKFADLVTHAPDGILAVDEDGVVRSMNPAAAHMLGCDADAAPGRPLAVLAPELCAGLPACTGAEVGPGDVSAELLVLRNGGGTVTAEATARAVPLEGGRTGMQIMLRNVSERRSAEELAAQLGGIVENALNEIYIFAAVSGRLVRVNRGGRDNLGYQGGELAGLTWADINPTLGPDGVREVVDRLGHESAISLRGLHRRQDGSAYPVETQIQAGTLGGEPVVVAFAVDVSERETAEKEQRDLQAQLQHAQKMEAVGHLAGGVAHDFNNLLTVVGGYAALLEASDDPETRTLAAEISRAQERGASLTRQLLAFARKEVAQPRVISLAQAVRDMERILLRVLGERYALKIDARGQGWITADVGQVEQVVMNLVANAKDAMPDGGNLTLTIGEPDPLPGQPPMVCLDVEDTGTGMDDETLARIFQPFFTTKPRGKGTGLGLATVHGIVTQNQASIHVESRLDEGTRVRILWPRSTPVEVRQLAGEIRSDETGGSETILLAEDDDAMRSLVIRLLETAGYRVIPAQHGAHALELSDAHAGTIDLLLTDMVMPGLSGIDVAERIRSRRPGIGVLFMSGYLDDDLHADSRMDPARELLLKPFRGPELLARVRETLEADAAPSRQPAYPRGGGDAPIRLRGLS